MKKNYFPKRLQVERRERRRSVFLQVRLMRGLTGDNRRVSSLPVHSMGWNSTRRAASGKHRTLLRRRVKKTKSDSHDYENSCDLLGPGRASLWEILLKMKELRLRQVVSCPRFSSRFTTKVQLEFWPFLLLLGRLFTRISLILLTELLT